MRLIGVLTFCIISAGSALGGEFGQIVFVPAGASLNPGGAGTIGIVVTGLTAPVGAFDVEFSYSPALIAGIDSVTYFNGLGNPNLGEAVTLSDTSIPGQVSLAEVSLLTATELDARQGTNLPLAQVVIRAGPSIGSTLLSFTRVILADADGLQMTQTGDLVPGVVNVVPEPGTVGLVLAGCLLVAAGRSRMFVRRRP